MKLRTQRAGFTLAEVAVTLVIVGITLLWVLEGLNRAKLTAAHTHHSKIAAELGLQTLTEIEAGLYWEDIDEDGMAGNYAEEGYEEFAFEVVLGEETFPDWDEDTGRTLEHDTWLHRQELEQAEADENGYDEDDEEEQEEPYEKVRIRVTFPRTNEQKPELVLERWIPWDQVYGLSEEDLIAAEEAEADQ